MSDTPITTPVTGRCECGAVRFEVTGLRDSVTVCHCSQCRRTSGHLWASSSAPDDKVVFSADDGLSWYHSSETARRGFCRICGSSLFYRMEGDPGLSIAAGCLDLPTGLHASRHIFTASKGDYYEIADGLPQDPGH